MNYEKLFTYLSKNTLSLLTKGKLDSLYERCCYIAENNIAGDFVETGVYKGGSSLVMALVNETYKLNKNIWLCDSFIGCPDPLETKLGTVYGERHWKGDFSASLETVTQNFKDINLWTDNIRILEGWFEDTLPNCEIEKISLLHFDGDLYSSTLEVLYNLYDKVEIGGIIIIDDYSIEACKIAVHQFLNERSIKTPINKIDKNILGGVWWIKED